MADITVTAANVLKGAGALTAWVTAGATITAGMPVYYDAATNEYLIGHSETSAITADIKGIALNNASNNQPLEIVLQDDALNLGATLAIGVTYVLSASGGISPDADASNVAPDFKTVIGVATTAALLKMRLAVSGVAIV